MDINLQIEQIKTNLFMSGTEAINDFLGYECPYDDKDVIDNLMEEILQQMPDEEINDFYNKLELDNEFDKEIEEETER